MKIDFTDVIKVSLMNFLIIGAIATLFILGEKIVLNKWPVAGVTDAVNAI